MNAITVIVGTLVISVALFTFGYSQGKSSVHVTDFEEYVTLSHNMSNADTEIATLQSDLTAARDKEVIKYVKVYRDRIKDPVTVQCVSDSGLLSAYDASVSTTIK